MGAWSSTCSLIDATFQMTDKQDLKQLESHFSFGKNWASYASTITDRHISEAHDGFRRLLGSEIVGRRMLDIGCGSGVHSLAALNLGAREVVATDIDPDSVATTRSLLSARVQGAWRALEVSVFDLTPSTLGSFDVVYSWGVLHHTGDLGKALAKAADLVSPGGYFALALYRRTLLCPFWKMEKRWYAGAGEQSQRYARNLYIGLYRAMFALRGKNFSQFMAEYPERNRGMDFAHDVHDWLGGWPYESITFGDVAGLMKGLGFNVHRSYAKAGRDLGLFGSGCDEYVFTKSA